MDTKARAGSTGLPCTFPVLTVTTLSPQEELLTTLLISRAC